jgi:hypothetical protein
MTALHTSGQHCGHVRSSANTWPRLSKHFSAHLGAGSSGGNALTAARICKTIAIALCDFLDVAIMVPCTDTSAMIVDLAEVPSCLPLRSLCKL